MIGQKIQKWKLVLCPVFSRHLKYFVVQSSSCSYYVHVNTENQGFSKLKAFSWYCALTVLAIWPLQHSFIILWVFMVAQFWMIQVPWTQYWTSPVLWLKLLKEEAQPTWCHFLCDDSTSNPDYIFCNTKPFKKTFCFWRRMSSD